MSSNHQGSMHAGLDHRFGSLQLGSSPDLGGSQYYSNSGASTASHHPQSASARFERFFNTAPPPAGTTSDASSPYSQYHALPGGAMHGVSSLSGAPAGTSGLGGGGVYTAPGSAAFHGSNAAAAFGSIGSTKGSPMPPHHGPASAGAIGTASLRSSRLGGGATGPLPGSMRSNIPTQWSVDPSISPHLGGATLLPSPGTAQSPLVTPPGSGHYGHGGPDGHANLGGGSRSHRADGLAPVEGMSSGHADDDVIPTAIVVKNIPFSVKREQLLQIIEDLAIPMPYAFNYHFDQGVFRGLAFANFRSSEEADAVVAALNGFDVSGRKLRVEYKKVLQAGEKERIEKEKALKRMRSMQLEKERSRRDGDGGGPGYGSAPPPLPVSPTATSPAPPALTSDAYGSGDATSPAGHAGEVLPGGHPGATQSDRLSPPTSRTPLTADSLRSVPSAVAHTATPSDRSGLAKKEELDLNNPQTLEIYSRVLLFKDDRMRDELAFSRNLSPQERRTVHLVAQKLSLYHYSLGEGEERHVIVTKHEVRPHSGSRPLRSQASTIGRSQRSDGGSSLLQIPGGSGPGATSSSRMAPGLRGKKSAPDMKRVRDYHEYSGAGGAGTSAGSVAGGGGGGSGSVTPLYGASSTLSLGRKSNSSMRDGSTTPMRRPGTGGGHSDQNGGGGIGGAAGLQSLFASPFEVPPVPSLGSSSYHGHGGQHTEVSAEASTGPMVPATGGGSGALRQPRGPPAPGQSIESRNFAPRSRAAGTYPQRPRSRAEGGDGATAADVKAPARKTAQVDHQSDGPLDALGVQSRPALEL
ncbi:unnamed protein product [Parajaminaea phylloscopi]